jgi:hypothetical protein
MFDLTQLQALRDFKHRMDGQGLLASFKSESELSEMVARAIEFDVRMFRAREEPTMGGPKGVPLGALDKAAIVSPEIHFRPEGTYLVQGPPSRTKKIPDHFLIENEHDLYVNDVQIAVTSSGDETSVLNGPSSIRPRSNGIYILPLELRPSNGDPILAIVGWRMDGQEPTSHVNHQFGNLPESSGILGSTFPTFGISLKFHSHWPRRPGTHTRAIWLAMFHGHRPVEVVPVALLS